MRTLINKEVFLEIFKNEAYRKKLDKLLLNFFGISPKDIINSNKIKNTVILEFIICIEKEVVMNILVVDTKNLFKYSKKFYINFCLKENTRNYLLIYPCYWEFYCQSCMKKKRHMKKIEVFASLFTITSRKEMKKTIKKLKTFNKQEINDMMKKIERKEDERDVFYKDK